MSGTPSIFRVSAVFASHFDSNFSTTTDKGNALMTNEPVKTILCAVDESTHAKTLVRRAFEFAAQLYADQLVLCTVASLKLEVTSDEPIEEPRSHAISRARARLRELESAFDSTLPIFKVEARLGDPAMEILRAAEAHQADLIVLGTAGRKGIRRAIMGSVAETVLRESETPVLVFRLQ